MKSSQLFTKTSKDIPSDETSENAKLLLRAGYVNKTMAGVYSMLPLGLRTLNKIENIVRKRMNEIGGQEIRMNSLHPKDWWTTTGRWESVDILFKLQSQTQVDYALACSHEEQVNPIAKNYINSWKDLPEYEIVLAEVDESKPDLDFKPVRETAHAVVYCPARDQYLVIDNRKTYSASEYDYYPVGGGIDEGEVLEEALSREFAEETGQELAKVAQKKEYLGVVKQKFYCRAVEELKETNKELYSHMFYLEVKDFADGYIEEARQAYGEITKWLSKDDLKNMLPGFSMISLKPFETEPISQSYPLCTYQIQTKFRDELRAKSGLLRGREFRMKDMYDFHQTQQSADRYYEVIKQAYLKAYTDMGIEAYPIEASGGIFTNNLSHEFQAVCLAGEDKTFFVEGHNNYIYNQEVAPVKATPWSNQDEIEKEMQEVEGKGIIGAGELAKFLDIPVQKTTKTILFETEKGQVVAVAVRGDYDISEEKVIQIVGSQALNLASQETVKRVTGAEVGYAGILNLPKEVVIIMDDSLQGRKNFEMGANKTNYHSVNVNFGRDLELPEKFYDVKLAKEGDIHPETCKPYKSKITAEVGNIFKFGTKYTKDFGISYTDKNNQQQYPILGAHGIGTTRCMAVIAEIYNDSKGLKWPESVAPFLVHLVTHLNPKDDPETNQKILSLAKKIYSSRVSFSDSFEINLEINSGDSDVFWDDRVGINMGQKLKDADLIGMPWQIIISKRSLENGGVEVKNRATDESRVVAV